MFIVSMTGEQARVCREAAEMMRAFVRGDLVPLVDEIVVGRVQRRTESGSEVVTPEAARGLEALLRDGMGHLRLPMADPMSSRRAALDGSLAGAVIAASDVRMEMPTEVAQALSQALDVFSRVGMGQWEVIAEVVHGPWTEVHPDTSAWQQRDELQTLLFAAKRWLGHPQNGSFGIAARGVHDDMKRAWEIKKQIDQALVHATDAARPCYDVRSDGRILRLTADPDISVAAMDAPTP